LKRTGLGLVALHKTSVPSSGRPATVPPMNSIFHTADVLTSARMAAGMTSRARRPVPCIPAG